MCKLDGRNGRNVLMQLIKAYREEASLYAGLEQAAREQHDLLLNGQDRQRLDALLERQRDLAEHIGRIESAIAPLREYWEKIRCTAQMSRGTPCGKVSPAVRPLVATLDDLLDDLIERIHKIVEMEKEDAKALVSQTADNRA